MSRWWLILSHPYTSVSLKVWLVAKLVIWKTKMTFIFDFRTFKRWLTFIFIRWRGISRSSKEHFNFSFTDSKRRTFFMWVILWLLSPFLNIKIMIRIRFFRHSESIIFWEAIRYETIPHCVRWLDIWDFSGRSNSRSLKINK